MDSGTTKSIKKRLGEYLETRQPPAISEAVCGRNCWPLSAPVSESYLRDLLLHTGLPFEQPYTGINQHSLEELERSLLDMLTVYSSAVADGDRQRARYCRRVVIAAKDRAKFLCRDGRTTPEKRSQKEEMAQWMLVWLENPVVFPAWAEARKKAAPVLTLTGAPNFRDIGGLPTSDGHTVRSGKLYRSGQFTHLTESDYRTLSTLGIRVVFDLRTDGEREESRTRWIGSPAPELVSSSIGFGATPGDVPIGEMLRQNAAALKTEQDARALMIDGMAELIESGRSQMSAILSRLSAGDVPAIVHCTAGKDRTGLFTAILLTMLGVPRDRIVEDYLRSHAAMSAAGALPAGMQSLLDVKILRPLMTVEPAYLEASFDRIDMAYGSFDEYRRQGLNVTDEQLADLKAIFLE